MAVVMLGFLPALKTTQLQDLIHIWGMNVWVAKPVFVIIKETQAEDIFNSALCNLTWGGEKILMWKWDR